MFFDSCGDYHQHGHAAGYFSKKYDLHSTASGSSGVFIVPGRKGGNSIQLRASTFVRKNIPLANVVAAGCAINLTSGTNTDAIQFQTTTNPNDESFRIRLFGGDPESSNHTGPHAVRLYIDNILVAESDPVIRDV